MVSSAFLPVSFTFSAFTITMLSPQSTCGVNCGLCLPRRRLATMAARRPSTSPSASIRTQSFFTSAGFSEIVVFIILHLKLERGLSGFSRLKSSLLPCGIIIPRCRLEGFRQTRGRFPAQGPGRRGGGGEVAGEALPHRRAPQNRGDGG